MSTHRQGRTAEKFVWSPAGSWCAQKLQNVFVHLTGGNHSETAVPCRAPAAALDHTWGHRTATAVACAAANTSASLRGAAKVDMPRKNTGLTIVVSTARHITIAVNQCCDHWGREE